MKAYKTIIILIIGVISYACDSDNMKEESALIFSKGTKIESNNFTGNAYLEMLVDADSINKNSVGSVTFEPGARTNWHTHPNGQIILALDGMGYYQVEGRAQRILKKGDVVKCPANIAHWHGASEHEKFIQVAITSRSDGPTEWLDKVSDEVYMFK